MVAMAFMIMVFMPMRARLNFHLFYLNFYAALISPSTFITFIRQRALCQSEGPRATTQMVATEQAVGGR